MNNQNSNRSRNVIVTLALALLLLLAVGAGQTMNAWNTSARSNDTQSIEYPRAWHEAGLPEIPESEIVDQATYDRGVCRFEIETGMSTGEVGDFLETELEKRDWDFYVDGYGESPEYANDFVNNRTEVIINADPDSNSRGKTRVKIAIRINPHRNSTAPTGLTSTSSSIMAD